LYGVWSSRLADGYRLHDQQELCKGGSRLSHGGLTIFYVVIFRIALIRWQQDGDVIMVKVSHRREDRRINIKHGFHLDQLLAGQQRKQRTDGEPDSGVVHDVAGDAVVKVIVTDIGQQGEYAMDVNGDGAARSPEVTGAVIDNHRHIMTPDVRYGLGDSTEYRAIDYCQFDQTVGIAIGLGIDQIQIDIAVVGQADITTGGELDGEGAGIVDPDCAAATGDGELIQLGFQRIVHPHTVRGAEGGSVADKIQIIAVGIRDLTIAGGEGGCRGVHPAQGDLVRFHGNGTGIHCTNGYDIGVRDLHAVG